VLMVMPDGAETRLKVRMFTGMSGSVAEAETLRVVNSLIVWSDGTVRTGGLFTSLTMALNDLVWLRLGDPSSVTRTVTVFVLGPCASVGVQEIAPVFVLMVIPAGAETKLKVKLLAGISGSVAEADTLSVVSSLRV